MVESRVLDAADVFKTTKKLLGEAHKSVLLVSPFITSQLFESILKTIDKDVDVTLVTRFRPDEIAKGLNDLRLFDIMHERSKGQLRLSYQLHAKYYRADNAAVLGSGNLTRKGLNVQPGGNHEIMILVDTGFPGLIRFESEILAQSTVPTGGEISDLQEMVEILKLNNPHPKLQTASLRERNIDVRPEWIPNCESPSVLYYVYLDNLREIDLKIVEDAKTDLAYLSIPNGMNEEQFQKYVRIVMQQSILMATFSLELDKNRMLAEIVGINLIMKSLSVNSEEAKKLWFSSINWLAYFFPEKFTVNVN